MRLEQKSLDNFVLPERGFPIVFLQPHFDIQTGCNGIAKINNGYITKQLKKVIRTLKIGLNYSNYDKSGFKQASFIIFPEYSIPGLRGFNIIKFILKRSKSNNLAVIGGIDGLSPEEYLRIEEEACFKGLKIEPTKLNNHWVNTCFILFKGRDDNLELFLQPKLSAAPLESQMYENDDFVYIWKIKREGEGNRPFNFFVTICFDLIAKQSCGARKILKQLNVEYQGSTFNLDMILNIQRNNKVFHDSFKGALQDIFDKTQYRCIERGRMIVFIVNNAGKIEIGKCSGEDQFGNSAMVFSNEFKLHKRYKKSANHTFTFLPALNDPTRKYLTHDNAKVMVFREKGDCLHSLIYEPIATSGGTPEYPPPIEPDKAYVFGSFNESIVDNRNNGFPVYCYTKWFLDQLDEACSYSFRAYKKNSNDFSAIKLDIINSLGNFTNQDYYYQIMEKAYAYVPGLVKNADRWDMIDRGSVLSIISFNHYFKCLLLLKIAFKDDFCLGYDLFHGKIDKSFFYFISGESIVDIASKIDSILERSLKTNPQPVFTGRGDVEQIVFIAKANDHVVDLGKKFDITSKKIPVKQISENTINELTNIFDENEFCGKFQTKLGEL